jgi:inosine-uridine nucleoside N-ribohydrolase
MRMVATMARRPVILDCDPGHDDVVAILLACASDELDVKAVTIVAGNQTLDRVLDNCLRLMSLAEIRNVPVAAGCAGPLTRPLLTAGHVHGESGLDGADLPPRTLEPLEMHAVDLIAQILRDSPEPVTLIPTAPMTNIALLLLKEPAVKSRIREIVFMGGCDHAGERHTVGRIQLPGRP